MKDTLLLIISVLLMVSMALNIGLAFEVRTSRTITVPEYIVTEKVVTVNVTTERIITNNVTVERVVTNNVTVEPKQFPSLEALKEFLALDNSDKVVYLIVNTSGVASLNGICEDRAFHLQEVAKKQGFVLETELLTKPECYQYNEYLKFSDDTLANMPDKNSHMILKAIIGNAIYFIEPSNDSVWHPYNLD
jgi:hypothetical protein